MKTALKLAMTALVWLPSQALAQAIVTERDTTQPCMIGPGQPCTGAKIGSVLQVWPGEDVHVWRKDGKYLADFYAFGHVFNPAMFRGRASYDSLEALNAQLAAKGFDRVDEREIAGPCEIQPGEKCRGAETGKVLQKSEEPLDVYVVKEKDRYLAEYYTFEHVFDNRHKRNTDSFSALADLNASLQTTGFSPVTEADVTGPCFFWPRHPCPGVSAGKVMQISKGKDIHVEKRGGEYVATIYPFGQVFRWPQDGGSFKTLAGLNTFLVEQFASSDLQGRGSLVPMAMALPFAKPAHQAAHDLGARKGIVVEALVDGDEELHLRTDGLYWVNGRFAKPGKHDNRNAPTYVNGTAWLPSWTQVSNDYGPDKSDFYKLDVGSLNLGFKVLSVSKERGRKGMDPRDPVVARRTTGEFILSIPDSQDGSRWYTLSIYRK